MKISDYTDRWDEEILSLKKPATISSMRCHIRRINDTFGSTPIHKLDESTVQRNITLTSKTLSPRATRNYWNTFHLILSRAKQEGLILNVPSPVLPKGGSKPQLSFTQNEMRTLAQQHPLWFLFAETGLRAGEVFGLKVSDVDLETQRLSVNRSVYGGILQEPKSDNAYRTISISPELCKSLAELMGQPGDFVFATSRKTPYKQSYVLPWLHNAIRDVLKYTPISGFHAFRRGNATLSAHIGMPLKTLSYRQGRKTGDLTTDIYIHYSLGSDREYADQLGKILTAPLV